MNSAVMVCALSK